MTTTYTPGSEDLDTIRDLRQEAAAHGDNATVDLCDAALETGDCGHLYDYETNEPIAPATPEQLIASITAYSQNGVIEVDGRSVYVQ